MNTIDIVQVNFELDVEVSFQEAKERLESLISIRNTRGFKVVSVTPIISGHSEYSDEDNRSYGLGFGYTSGFLVVFESIQE